MVQRCDWVEQIGSVPVPETGKPLQVGGAVLLAPHATATFLLKVVDQQAVGQVGGKKESWVGRVEGPISSHQAGHRSGVGIAKQLQAVTIQCFQIGQLKQSLEE